MSQNITFRLFTGAEKLACLALFDANCPQFFAPNERLDYVEFLDASPLSYELCLINGEVVGAFGLSGNGLQQNSLNWILLNPNFQGMGIGSSIMNRISAVAHQAGVRLVKIAASHKSAPFFAKFGAIEIAAMKNGWGPGMHRIDMELHL